MIQLTSSLPWMYQGYYYLIIETFIDKHFRGNEEYYSNPMLATKPFVFPPGHKLRISNFISEVSGAIEGAMKCKRKRVGSSKCHLSKLPRTVREDAVEPELVYQDKYEANYHVAVLR